MGLFDKIKEIKNKVSEVETNIYNEKKDYLEIYERNIELEKEIAERTEQLNDANKRMFTLQHIWDMMNSSTPLENVLDAIVNSTQGELGYMHCSIFRKLENEDGTYIQVLAQSKDEFFNALNNCISTPAINTRELKYTDGTVFSDTIHTKKIVQTIEVASSIISIIPDISKSELDKILKKQSIKSIIVIPLYTNENEFGWFCVFSSREELASSEIDFLNVFAKQTEMAITIADLFQVVREQAVTDALTGLYNRRYFESALEKEVQRAKRLKQPFSIIGLDLDYLKRINDTYGHNFGDIAINTIAKVLKTNARAIDVPARIGGEEFDILLPGVSSNGAKVAAERIRHSIETIEIPTIGHITGSLGVATYFEHTDNVEELLELTDQAMYTSKKNGRNQVTVATPISETYWQEVAINTFIEILQHKDFPNIDNKLAKELCAKLEQPANKDEISKESLYNVADTLTKTYNPMHKSGVIKNKVILALNLAKRFELPKKERDNLKVAMLLYDIGNLLLPTNLLQKATPLSDDELKEIKNHPNIAVKEILQSIPEISEILPIIEHHHENWDGTGYPNKISKEQIPLTSQIILIIDEYFALIEARPYRQKLSSKDALEIIKSDMGKKWNEVLVKEFISIIEQDII